MSGYRPTPMTRRIFLDTEWTAAPWSSESELMWIGLADEEGRVWSAISADAEIDPATNDFIAGAFSLISPDDLRLPGGDIQQTVPPVIFIEGRANLARVMESIAEGNDCGKDRKREEQDQAVTQE